nr:hypothetical protein [uncultured Sphingomonas sp.]
MTEVTNSQLAYQITTLLQQWNAREAEMRDWMAGAPDGGANGDGQFPLTDASGRSYLAPSLLKLVDLVEGPASLSATAQLLSETARDAAVAAQAAALTQADRSVGARDAAYAARDLTLGYKNTVEALWAQVAPARSDVLSAQAAVLSARDVVLPARDQAVASATAAAASAETAQDYAEAINPVQFVTFPELDTAIASVVGAAPTTMNALDELAAALGNDPNFATTIMAQIGGRAPMVHTHVIADVGGLQAALNGKLSFVDNAHGWGSGCIGVEYPVTMFGQAGRGFVALLDGNTASDPGTLYMADNSESVWFQINKGAAEPEFNFRGSHGTKFQRYVLVPDEAFGAGWDGSSKVPTQNAVYDALLTKADASALAAKADASALQAALDAKASLNGAVGFNDITTSRGDGTGALFFGGATHYIYLNANEFYFTKKVVVNGDFTSNTGTVNLATANTPTLWLYKTGNNTCSIFNDGNLHLRGPVNWYDAAGHNWGPEAGGGGWMSLAQNSGPNLVVSGWADLKDCANGTTGALRLRSSSASADVYMQITNSAASAQWGYWGFGSGGNANWNGTAGLKDNGGRVLSWTGSRAGGKCTISTAAPSGGSDGDVWFKV